MESALWRMKKTILSIIQVLVTVGILIWVFRDPQKRTQMLEALRHADRTWILIGIAAYGVVEILAAVRWYILLRVQDIRLGFLRVCGLLMIGIFFNQFMPGGTGGDVVKIFYRLQETPGLSKNSSVALKRRSSGLLRMGVVRFAESIRLN